MNATAERQPDIAYVYVIGKATGPQKVGFSVSPEDRCRALGYKRYTVHAAVPVPAESVRMVERYAHCILLEHHVGNEWFAVTPGVASAAVQKAADAVAAGEVAPFYPFLGKRKPKAPPTVALGLRISTSVKAALKEAARDDNRSMARYAAITLERHLKDKGYLK